jgi:hypothetical protein
VALPSTLEPQTPTRFSTSQAVLGIVAAAAAVVLIGALHVLPPSSRLDPVRRTISQYAVMETGWVFNVAVLALAVGSMAILAALVGARLTALISPGSIALLLWSAALVAVVIFPRYGAAGGSSTSAGMHRAVSLVAFLSLPAAALLLSRLWLRHPQWQVYARWVFGLGVAALLCFAPIGIAILTQPLTGVRWWQAVPLGAVERALALAEVLAVLALGWWAARASRHEADPVIELDRAA